MAVLVTVQNASVMLARTKEKHAYIEGDMFRLYTDVSVSSQFIPQNTNSVSCREWRFRQITIAVNVFNNYRAKLFKMVHLLL